MKNLENLLENASQDNSDLKLKLSGSEGRITGLEAQLARMEGSKNDLEFKLASLHSTLRRTLGIKPPGELSGRYNDKIYDITIRAANNSRRPTLSYVISYEFTFLPNHVSYSYFWSLSELHLLLVLVAQALVAVCSEGVGRARQKKPWRKP